MLTERYLQFGFLLCFYLFTKVNGQIDRRFPEYTFPNSNHLQHLDRRVQHSNLLTLQRNHINNNLFDPTNRSFNRQDLDDSRIHRFTDAPRGITAHQLLRNGRILPDTNRGSMSVQGHLDSHPPRPSVVHRALRESRHGDNRGPARYPEQFIHATRGSQQIPTYAFGESNIINSGVSSSRAPIHQHGSSVLNAGMHPLSNDQRTSEIQTQISRTTRFRPPSLHGPHSTDQVRHAEVSSSQVIPSLAGSNSLRHHIHFDRHPMHVYQEDSNEAFQYGTALPYTPLSLVAPTRRRGSRNQNRFSGEPVDSLRLPFEPLSVYYKQSRQTENSRNRHDRLGSVGESTPSRFSVSLGTIGPNSATMNHFSEPQHQTFLENRHWSNSHVPRQRQTGFETTTMRSLQQIFGLSPEAIRRAAQDYNSTLQAPAGDSAVRSSIDLARLRTRTLANGQGTMSNSLKPNTTTTASRDGGHTVNWRNANDQAETRNTLINEIGRIINMAQLLNILDSDASGDATDFIPESFNGDLEFSDGFND